MSDHPTPPPYGLPAIPEPARPPGARVPRAKAPPPTIDDVLRDRKYRIDGWTPLKVAAFIERLAEGGSVTRAAAYVGMTIASCYALRNRPGGEPFAEAWETAIASRHEMLTDIAMDRVRDGVERTRRWRGEIVGVDRVFSDRLLMFMLAATSPERARRGGGAAGVVRPAAGAAGVAGDPVALADATGGAATDADDAVAGLLAAPWAAAPRDSCTAGCTGGCIGDCAGECPTCDAPRPTACDLFDAETALPPDVAATMAARRAVADAERAATQAGVDAIGAALDAALGRGVAAGPGERQAKGE